MDKIILKYHIRKSFRVFGITKDSLNIESLFNYKYQKCTLSVKIHFSYANEEPFKHKLENDVEIFSTEVDKIDIELSNKSQEGFECLKEIIGEPMIITENDSNDITISQKTQLYVLLVSIINMILKNVRVVGKCTLVNEIPIEPYKANALINLWNVEKKVNNENWVKIIDIQGLSQLLYYRQLTSEERPFSYFLAENWSDVEEALSDNLSTEIQFELLINSQDYLEIENYRMAVAECVSALDIVLRDYTNNFYKLEKKAPKKIIEFIESPNFTMSEQIGTIIYLRIKEKFSLEDSFIESIVRMNKLRNDILHRGKILSKDEKKFIKDMGFKNIRFLTELLSDEATNIKLDSVLKEKLIDISTEYKIPIPVVKKKKRHNYNIEIHFFGFGIKYEIPEKSKFKEITSKLIRMLEEYDSDFKKEKNLILKFTKGFPKTENLAFWNKDKLEINE